MTDDDLTRGTTRRPPTGVRWGTATAAYQVEGAAATDGRTPSIWDDFCREPGAVLHGDTGDVACDLYHRWDQALSDLRWLGVSLYRFSVSWSRVVPRDGEVNRAGLAYYRRVARSLREAGITPVVTLYHWDLPSWLQARGGWLSPEVVDRFGFFVRAVVDGLDGLVSDWITMNEPYCVAFHGYLSGAHAPGQRDPLAALRVTGQVLAAHARAVEVLRAAGPAHRVGIAVNLSDVHAATDSAADARAADLIDLVENRLFLSPLLRGAFPENGSEAFGARVWAGSTEQADLTGVDAPLDFFGVNYYEQHVVSAVDAGDEMIPGARKLAAEPPTSANGVAVRPDGFATVLRRLHRDWTSTPLWVCENGIGLHDYVGPDGECRDPERVAYFEAHLAALARVVDEGVPVEAYLAWTLQDSFEWNYGYQLRYGLFHTDFPTGRTLPKPSAHHYRRLIASTSTGRHHNHVEPQYER